MKYDFLSKLYSHPTTSLEHLFHAWDHCRRRLRALCHCRGRALTSLQTEAGTPTTTAWLLRMIQRAGRAAELPFPVHPHILRHSTGYKLAPGDLDRRLLATDWLMAAVEKRLREELAGAAAEAQGCVSPPPIAASGSGCAVDQPGPFPLAQHSAKRRPLVAGL
jgi:integrase